jgi:hypothetical protein
MELVQYLNNSWSLQFVHEDDHRAAWSQVLESMNKLRDGQPTGFALLSIGCALVGSENLTVTENNVECSGVIELFWEEVVLVRVVMRNLVHAEVGSEHGDIERRTCRLPDCSIPAICCQSQYIFGCLVKWIYLLA